MPILENKVVKVEQVISNKILQDLKEGKFSVVNQDMIANELTGWGFQIPERVYKETVTLRTAEYTITIKER